jgi:hypothetical protein
MLSKPSPPTRGSSVTGEVVALLELAAGPGQRELTVALLGVRVLDLGHDAPGVGARRPVEPDVTEQRPPLPVRWTKRTLII